MRLLNNTDLNYTIMKIFRTLIKLSAVAAVVLGIVACGGDKKNAPLASEDNMIPDNAVMAVKVMPEQLWEKAMGDPDSKASQMWSQMKFGMTLGAGAMGDFGSALNDVMKSPAALGLELNEPIVISFSGDLENIAAEKASVDLYAVALLSDKNAFVSFLDAAIAFAEENGAAGVEKSTDAAYVHYVFPVDKEGLYVDLGVSSESLVFRLSFDTVSKSKNLKKTMGELFANGHKKTEGLADFYASEADLSVWADFEGFINTLMPVIEMSSPSDVRMLEEYMPMYEDASMVSTLTFNDGQTVIDLNTYGSEEMMAYAQKYNDIASDKYFQYLPASSVFVANVALKDLPGLIDEVCAKSPEYAEAFEYLEESFGLDEEFYAGCPGLITVALDGHEIDSREVPGFIAYVECDENVWDFIASNLEEVADLAGPNQYCINDMFYVTYNGSAVILVEADTLVRNYAGGISSFASTRFAPQIRKGGFVFNIAALPSHILDSVAEEVDYYMTGRELLEFVSSVVVSSSDDHMAAKVVLNMDDHEHNLLEKIVDYVLGAVSF